MQTQILIADGAMGTMLQDVDLSLEDFDNLEGCNEILNLTRPDVVAKIHRAYFEAGADCVETNTFGANLTALNEYDISDRIEEIAQAAARIAREVADDFSTKEWPRFVLGSMGPGTKLPSLGQTSFPELRDAYQLQAKAMIEGGIDAVLIETTQDLLQAKAAVIGAKRAIKSSGVDIPVFVSLTIETSGTMLAGSEIGAALTTLEPLGIDLIGLNCATGPAEMGEHLRHLARHSRIGLSCMPNAGLPELTAEGAVYPLQPEEFTQWMSGYAKDFGLTLIGGCCGTHPEHIRQLTGAVRGKSIVKREISHVNAAASLYSEVPFEQDTSYLSVGERTNANGSKAFREAMLADNYEECVRIGKNQVRDGAHLLDLCVDYVGRDGVQDMKELAFRLNTAVTLPIMLDSTEPAILQAGLENLSGRAVINSVNFEDGDGPDSRFGRIMPLVKEHGAAVVALTIDENGQARTKDWKVEVASRLIDSLVDDWGMDIGDILVDCLTFPIATGQEETRNDGQETIDAIAEIKAKYPGVRTILGVSNISFGLNPAARQVLNSVFLHEAVEAGLDACIVHPSRILPMDRIPERQREIALDMVHNRRRDDYDPLTEFLTLFEGVTTSELKAEQEAELRALPVNERLQRRIVDGNDNGLAEDLEEALQDKPALEIINSDLLVGMKTVGELFGSGQMQLPFVLQSAEVMKKAVALLEPSIPADQRGLGKGKIVLATVKGDVHDIGKNLVDIILSNNGYTVVNLGIKQPINAIIEAAEQHQADAIGMSGLLVKSTMVMRDNLLELNQRGLADKYPVLLGGAALTRTYVEQDLQGLFDGEVRYGKDAFEGLNLMDAVMAVKRGEAGAELPKPRERRVKAKTVLKESLESGRSDVDRRIAVPTPPFFGSRIVKGIALADITEWLDERATFMGRWGMRATKDGFSYAELVETEARPRLRSLLDEIQVGGLGEFAVAYGYWPVYSENETLHVLDPSDHTNELTSFNFPRQRRDPRLCLADYFRDKAEMNELGPDVLGLQLVTMGSKISEATDELFKQDQYRHYLELHGLSVQLTEALAELWHHRIRGELGILAEEGTVIEAINKQTYRGSRYSLGYGACPNLEDRAKIFSLLEADRIGVQLSEEFQLHPEQSTDAFVVHHPQAKYFST